MWVLHIISLFNNMNKSNVKCVNINGKTSGIVLLHLDHQTSLARTFLDQRPREYGHIE